MNTAGVLEQAESAKGQIIQWRRQVHQWPELGFEEERTADLAATVLRQLECRVRTAVGRTGVVGEVGSGAPVVALRADMDALPIEEESGLPFASARPGLMHACGHDAHVAMLLGAATILSTRALPGTVRFLFQPSEESADAEGLSGAARMVADGAMDGVATVFALHVIPELPTGSIGVRAGAVQASADALHLTVRGRGAHAAYPHLGRDPIFIAAQLISALQGIVSRTVDPLAPAVITLGSIHGGTRANIIPESVAISGTIRALDEATRAHLADEIGRVATVAAALGGECDVDIVRGYPVTVNDAGAVSIVRAAAADVLGQGRAVEVEPSMGAEDFSLLAARAPGCFFRLGVTPPGGEPTRIHSPRFRLDEDALPLGAALLAACALERLAIG